MKVVLKKLILPDNSPKRLGVINPKFITIHETSLGTELQPAEKNANRYYNMLLNDGRQVGYHFLVEANIGEYPVVYQFLETKVKTKHTGSETGNSHSLGIERLVNVNTNMGRAINVQARLTASLMNMYNIPIEAVVAHKFWSGKNCPSRILAGQYGGWEAFIKLVEHHLLIQDWIKGIL